MRTCCYILIALSLGCYKKKDEIEAIPLEKIVFKTTLKNHTPGIDYVINKSIEVAKELIIEEGVEIIIEAGCELTILDSGSIKCNGSSDHPVVFKNKNNTARWKGIVVFSKVDNKLNYTHIMGAGSAGNNHAALEVKPNANISLSHCKIEDNGEASGLLITEKAKCLIGEGCEFRNNYFPMQVELHAVFSIGSGSNMQDNTHNAIMVMNQDGSALSTKSNLKFVNYGLPYYFPSTLTIRQYIVTVNSGVTFQFESYSGIVTSNNMQDMGASLVLNGTVMNRITLGSFRSNPKEAWSGVTFSNGSGKFYYTNFNKTNSTFKELAIFNIRNYAIVDCRYCSFNADKTLCNISLIGPGIAFNADIFTRNTFANGLLPCLIL